jgi:hypothetical protein
MSVIDELLAHNRAYVARHGHRELPTAPQLHLAVLTCMDSRLDLFGALGLELGEAHLIRNAGGIATDDAVRSLLLSQRLLDTRAVSRPSTRRACSMSSKRPWVSDRRFDSAPTTTSTPTSVRPSPR